MNLTIYQIDAFAENTFEGNPTTVVPLEKWLPDKTCKILQWKIIYQKQLFLFL